MEGIERLRPKLRREIAFSLAETRAGRVVYYANDSYTGQFYRIGEKEHFILTRMDGRATLSEITREYEARFGVRLTPQSWDGLFGLVEQRQMLEGSASPQKLDELKERLRLRKEGENKRWLNRRFHLANPDRAFGRLLPYVGFMFHPAVAGAGLTLIVAVEAWVLVNLGAIGEAARGASTQAHLWPAFILLILGSAVIHELAHGLACKRFAGRVDDVGIVWRYLWFYPYCNLDPIVLCHNRRHRVLVSFAGPYVSLLLLIPSALLWWASEPGGFTHAVSAKMLTWFNIMSLLNLVPFVQLDGYFMLSHALGISDLRRESMRYLRRVLRGVFKRAGDEPPGYAPREKLIYSIYGPLAVLTTGLMMAFMLTVWYRMLSGGFATPGAALVGAFLLVILFRFGFTRLKKFYAARGGRASPSEG